MNFKKEYQVLVKVFPDIGKISRLGHFKIIWKRPINNNEGSVKVATENLSTDMSMLKSEVKGEGASQLLSQKK